MRRRLAYCRAHRRMTRHEANGRTFVCIACARRSAEYRAAYAFLAPPAVSPRSEIVRRRATPGAVLGLDRPRELGLPLEAFAPPLPSRRGGARSSCFYETCPQHRDPAA